MNMELHRQKGASLVEMAIVLILFLMIIFAVIEFSLATFRSAQLAEATGVGLRYAIVNDPLTGTELPACTAAVGLVATVECDSGSCPGIIGSMANIAPIIIEQEGDISVTVDYTCPASGHIERDDVYLVTVTVTNARYDFIVPGILGLGTSITLQDFKSTRLSEDLHTASGG
jgi:hypothetical protein